MKQRYPQNRVLPNHLLRNHCPAYALLSFLLLCQLFTQAQSHSSPSPDRGDGASHNHFSRSLLIDDGSPGRKSDASLTTANDDGGDVLLMKKANGRTSSFPYSDDESIWDETNTAAHLREKKSIDSTLSQQALLPVKNNSAAVDTDGDGDPDATDCAPTDKRRYHGAKEIPNNTIDEDCDGYDLATWYRDQDGDGFGNPKITILTSLPVPGYVKNNLDCNDYLPSYRDADNDGWGSEERMPCGGIFRSGDCDDNDIRIHTPYTWYRDVDGDKFGNPADTVMVCTKVAPTGYVSNGTDCDDANPKVRSYIFWRDYDGDGFGYEGSPINVCTPTPPPGYVTNYEDFSDYTIMYEDKDGDLFGTNKKVPYGAIVSGDCNDNDNSVYPGGEELPDGKDNNCDGQVDEGQPKTWYQDKDGDGYGNQAQSLVAVIQPAGYVLNSQDCNDADKNTYPNAPEIADGKDNNCNGTIDDGVSNTWYRDRDGDGFGDPKTSLNSATKPVGYVANNADCNDNYLSYEDKDGDSYGIDKPAPCGWTFRTGDCDDNDKRIHSPRTWYRDLDGDRYGNLADTIVLCQANTPAGYTSNNTDCNDNNKFVLDCPAASTRMDKGNSKVMIDQAPGFGLGASPNPFGTSVRILYALPAEARVSISVYDITGRKVAIVFNGQQSAGTYTREFASEKLSSGVYYCRMVAIANGNEFWQMVKLVKTN